MQVIAGKHRTRQLLGPVDDKTTRPILGRVKKSLFDRLVARDLFTPEDLVLDLFCGTGSLGIEAISRGIGHCIFVDRDRRAIDRLKQNLNNLHETENATVWKIDLFKQLPGRLAECPLPPAGLIFFDPPYRMVTDDRWRQKLALLLQGIRPAATEQATLIYRTPRDARIQTIRHWQIHDQWHYGSMTLYCMHPEPSTTDAP